MIVFACAGLVVFGGTRLAYAACSNPSPLSSGYAAPCPVFSVSPAAVSQTGSLSLTASPQPGTDYIYTTAYYAKGSSWLPVTLTGNNAAPSYSTSQASGSLNASTLSSLPLGTNYVVLWDWLWDSTAQCYKGPGLDQCNTGTWRIQTFTITATYTYSQSGYYTYSQAAYATYTYSQSSYVSGGKQIYLTQNASGSNDGSSCSNAHAASWFNTVSNWGSGTTQIGPGTTVHLCGTFTFPAGSTGFIFQGSGTSGNPITLFFETGAVLQAPYFAASVGGTCPAGGISMCGRSFVTIDGGTNGILQNTANGDNLANHQTSAGIAAWSCSNCTVKNLAILNIYAFVTNGANSPDATQVNAITGNGSNWTITNNRIDNCGWCLFINYGNGDTNLNVGQNQFSHFGHAVMYATSNANASTNFFLHDNDFHDTSNLDRAGCPNHQDGLHTFGVVGSSMDGVYVYNNYFHGDWGTCPTGFIFVEFGGGAGGTPSNMRTSAWWNNVFVVSPTTTFENTNSWFDIASGISGTQKVFNNTFIGPKATDNTLCISMQNLSSVSFQDNVISNCGDPVRIENSTVAAANNNLYGPSCQNGNNCFIWNGSFTGSFSSWKASCNCDSASVQSNSPLLNADGSPQSGSPLIGLGANLTSLATGNVGSLASDTSKGNTRTPIPRPTTGAWDTGAYKF